jgi:hypothetical protein
VTAEPTATRSPARPRRETRTRARRCSSCSTKPAALWEHHDPVGPENDYYLRKLALEFETVVFAWGTNARPDRVKQVYDIFTKTGRNRQVLCLGTTANGSPRHPLYVKGDTPLIEWKLAA